MSKRKTSTKKVEKKTMKMVIKKNNVLGLFDGDTCEDPRIDGRKQHYKGDIVNIPIERVDELTRDGIARPYLEKVITAEESEEKAEDEGFRPEDEE